MQVSKSEHRRFTSTPLRRFKTPYPPKKKKTEKHRTTFFPHSGMKMIYAAQTRKFSVHVNAKHTAAGIPTWSPAVVLICRSTAHVWQSGRDAQFSTDYGRMYLPIYQEHI
jgi:hypothetical protein